MKALALVDQDFEFSVDVGLFAASLRKESRYTLTPAQELEFRRMWRRNVTTSDMAAHFDVPPHQILLMAKHREMPSRAKNHGAGR